MGFRPEPDFLAVGALLIGWFSFSSPRLLASSLAFNAGGQTPVDFLPVWIGLCLVRAIDPLDVKLNCAENELRWKQIVACKHKYKCQVLSIAGSSLTQTLPERYRGQGDAGGQFMVAVALNESGDVTMSVTNTNRGKKKQRMTKGKRTRFLKGNVNGIFNCDTKYHHLPDPAASCWTMDSPWTGASISTVTEVFFGSFVFLLIYSRFIRVNYLDFMIKIITRWWINLVGMCCHLCHGIKLNHDAHMEIISWLWFEVKSNWIMSSAKLNLSSLWRLLRTNLRFLRFFLPKLASFDWKRTKEDYMMKMEKKGWGWEKREKVREESNQMFVWRVTRINDWIWLGCSIMGNKGNNLLTFSSRERVSHETKIRGKKLSHTFCNFHIFLSRWPIESMGWNVTKNQRK